MTSETVPIPAPLLRHSSTGTTDLPWFLESGRLGSQVVRQLLGELVPPVRVLDFGCGCGRVARHLVGRGVVLHGVDWNRRAVRWCRRHLSPGSFLVGTLGPPLPLDASFTFDVIYAFSVFTHMTEALQRAWLDELGARLDPGGILAVSTHGEAFVEHLSPEEHASFSAGSLVVREPVAAGTNVCAAYHPPGSFERLVPASLAVWRHIPSGALGNPLQDLWLLGSTKGARPTTTLAPQDCGL